MQELKKILAESKGLENFKQLEASLLGLEGKLSAFRENAKAFKRILGQELQLLLPNPQVLQDLDILRETIIKVRELGDKLNQAIEEMDEFSLETGKFRRQMGGFDLMKRYRDLTAAEIDH